MKIILSILISMAILEANTINIILPKVPEVPLVPQVKTYGSSSPISNAEIIKKATQEKLVHFSNHVAPIYTEKKDAKDKIIQVGDIQNGRVAAYLHAPLQTTSEVLTKLQNAGFTVLKTFTIDKKATATSITFTNKSLITLASKYNRGFASILRVTIDTKNKLISISNPIYVLKAFLQEDYNEKIATQTLAALRGTFKDLKNSKEVVKVRLLERYQFMKGMPKYEDMQIIKKEPTAELLEKIKNNNNVLYTQKLLNGATLIGVKLTKRTSKFIKKIGYQNAALLPYPVIIEKGEAKILDPKYYIAIMYPMLKMSQFMTIATIPGAINKEVDRVFR